MKKVLFIFFILIIIIIIVAGWLFNMLFLGQSNNSQLKTFIVEQGQGVNEISQNLKQQQLIDNSFVFETYIWLKKSENKIIAGEHLIQGDWNVNKIINTLISGNSIEMEMELTFIEGWDLRDIGFYLENQGIAQAEELWEIVGFPAVNYNVITDVTAPEDFSDDYPLLKTKSKNLSYEGFLFPDTYRLFNDASVEDIVRKMLANFERKITDEMLAEIKKQDKTLFDIITLASIIEKEANTATNKKRVSGVYYNRLDLGMALQADPTVNYVTGKKTDRPSYNDIETDNLYNTYEYPGLPLGPICNPGLDSINAAIYPEQHDYYFFINTPAGEMVFAKTHDEHVANRNKYFND